MIAMSSTPALQIVSEVLNLWPDEPASLLQVLVGIQSRLNHVPPEAIALLNERLGVPVSTIKGVIEFYSFLSLDPRGLYDIRFSDNIVDQALGGRERAEQLALLLGIQIGSSHHPCKASIDYTSCTGMGDQGPAALVNGYPLIKLTPDRIESIADLIKREVPLTEWPADFFQVEANLHHSDRLCGDWYEEGNAIQALFTKGKDAFLEELKAAGLRGCGGAGFVTADKWRFCRQADGNRVVICNADEGEPGTFKDRFLLQYHAGRVIDGMCLCAATIGAEQGFIYLRGEYKYLLEALQEELASRRKRGLLGKNILGNEGFNFDIEIHLGAGAYICGEESALIESLEGKRGIPRVRPPFPVTQGYLGKPTVVNNVETFVAAAAIAVKGADWYREKGTEQSPGTKLLSISGDCERPGIYEISYGMSISDILELCGAEDAAIVQVAGAAGKMLPPEDFQRTIAFEDVATGGSFMVFNSDHDPVEIVSNFIDFFAHESCGFCTPCRVGTQLVSKRYKKIVNRKATGLDLETIKTFGEVMCQTSHCGLGQTAARTILQSLGRFPERYSGRLTSTTFEPGFSLDEALSEARRLSHRDDSAAHIDEEGI